MINGDPFETAILKMGEMVGLNWATYDDVLEYQKQNGVNWYISRTWTTEQQDAFKDWMDDMLQMKTKWTSRKRDWEVACFVLCYGWRVEDEKNTATSGQ